MSKQTVLPASFTGFGDPTQNWSRLPHTFIDHLHLMTSEAEIKVVLYTLRHTWGYGDEEKKITIDEFARGRKRKDGSRIDQGCGMADNSIKKGIAQAIQHGFIVYREEGADPARIKRYYQLKSGGQKLTPRGSEVDPHPSDSDPRTEKETSLIETPGEKPLDDDHHEVDGLGILTSDVQRFGEQVGIEVPLHHHALPPEVPDPVYTFIDEDGNDLRDYSAEALLSRIWRATRSFRLKTTPDKKYHSQVLELQRRIKKDNRWAAYIEHQINWCFNEGQPNLGAQRWFEETLDLLGFQTWLDHGPTTRTEDANGIDTSRLVALSQLRHRSKRSPHAHESPLLPEPDLWSEDEMIELD
jgi:hypothetical protein